MKSNTRRGMASVLAMLYLVLFSSLAVGFYSATTMSAQVASNDQKGTEALMAAESGLQFVRYQLDSLDIPHNTPQNTLFQTVYTQIAANLNGTSNMGANTVGFDGVTISIPSGVNNYVALDNFGSQFQAAITQSGQQLVVQIKGYKNNLLINRKIQLSFGIAEKASAVFNYGIASAGKITMAGASQVLGQPDPTKGSILSSCMTDPTPVVAGGKVVSGDISIVNPIGNVTISGSIGGTTNQADINANHIHKGVDSPEFPTIDTSAFTAYATTKYVSGKTLSNNYIAPNTNPTFSGNTTINGVLYIQSPNVVTFSGNTTIHGVIVVPNSTTGTLSQNVLNFSGNTTVQDVSTLPASYGDLRSLTGAFILAPGFKGNFTGDFGTVNGSIIADNVNFSGNAGGKINGSIINLQNDPMTVNGSSDIIITSTGTQNYPSGVFFGSNYVALADTYQEVQ